MRKRKGQSILEYVIVLTVIIAAIIAAASTIFQESVNQSMTNVGASINATTNKLPGLE